ncbi:amidohydrolase [Siminovitchia terrae]|uniref:Amidohydrolase n=1 Tax=Siminovitchia terrae TaxID=1914933 RepID=A0ABQ4KZ07_SIMTE|nr:amidohydrolase [Siminovitchia terrae]GIN92404.1 amidohydrolase [Siminovitchia terrae]GIN97205.1 amidohydrolase [Siminovitchia terrae]
MSKVIFTKGKIYTFERNQPVVESIVVGNGKIVDLGSHDDMILQWGRSDTKIVDLQGKTVTPGLIDSHLHLSGVALQFLDLNLVGVRSKKEMLEKIRERANATEPEKWLSGLGFDENLFDDGGLPTIQELDEAAPHCPIFIKRVCHHAFLVNSKALEMIQYQPSMEVSTGGSVVLDPYTQKPTGLLLESASTLVTDRMPEKTYDELKHGLALAMEYAMQRGLTSAHTNDPRYLGGFDQTYKMYDELLIQEEKGLRCNLLIDYPFLDRLKERGMYAGYGNDTLQIGAIKIFADGALGRRTALLSQPYQDAPGEYGEAMQDKEILYQMVKESRDHSMPVAIHTIGDQAVDDVLQVLDQFPSVKHRDRIIHVSLLREDLIQRLAKPSLVADIQPRFVVGDYPWVQERLGKERIKYLYAWKSLLSAGVLCAGGSDAPVEPIDPLLGIHAAVTQRHPEDSHEGWNEKEKLSMQEALEVFTIGGAYATNEEDKKGTITQGKLADMTVFSRDLFEIEHPDELLDTEIEMTIIGGEIVYQK